MKVLTYRDITTINLNLFFSYNVKLDDVLDWVENNLNRFILNESESCIVIHDVENNVFIINGDEDYVELILKDVDIIF